MNMNKSITDSRLLRGMERQFQFQRERLRAGEKRIGWKVGFGAPAALQRLQLDAPLIGFLTDKIVLESGATISMQKWKKPALEPEIAVYLRTDLVGAVDLKSARAAIAAIGPAIELADVHFPPDDVEAILADNIFNRHVILGRADPSRAGCRLDDLEACIFRKGKEVAKTTDLEALTGNIVEVIGHAADLLSSLGERLQAGDVMIMGSVIPPIWIESSEEVQYRLLPIDSLTVKVVR